MTEYLFSNTALAIMFFEIASLLAYLRRDQLKAQFKKIVSIFSRRSDL